MGKAFKILPKNYLSDWGEFEDWAEGTGSAPTGWTRGTTPTVNQESTNIKFGTYSARIIGSNGAIGGIFRTIPDGDDYQGRTFSFGIWAKSASTGPYIEINDGVTSKTVHLDGLNAFAFHTIPSHKVDYAATQITIGLWGSINSTSYFDGAVLCEGQSLFLDLSDGTKYIISEWQPTISMKQDSYEISQREGSFIPDSHLQSRSIRVRGDVVGSDVSSARTHFDSLMKSLIAWQTNEKRSFYLYDDRVLDCFISSFDWNYKNGLKDIQFNMSLKSPESTTRYFNKFRNRQVIAASVTEFTFSYGGSTESKPILSFIANQGAAITTCSLENLTTGHTCAYTATVPINVALDIDCDLGTVLNSSADSIANFSGDFMSIVSGTNYLRFSGSNCEIHIDYYERFL